jgi:hypothetical protein
MRGFSSKLTVLEVLLATLIDHWTISLSKNVRLSSSAMVLSKLNDTIQLEHKLLNSFYASSIQTIIYPLIFSLGKDYMSRLRLVKLKKS